MGMSDLCVASILAFTNGATLIIIVDNIIALQSILNDFDTPISVQFFIIFRNLNIRSCSTKDEIPSGFLNI